MRITVAVESQNRGKYSPFKPADKQFLKLFCADISIHKAADISCPPWNTGNSHVQTFAYRSSEAFPGRLNVTIPDNLIVLLASNPGTAFKVYNALLSHSLLTFVESTAVHLRVNICHLKSRACLISVVAKIINIKVRFRVIQPEHIDPVISIVLFTDVP